jgi:inhibitor of KinA sporulation pathway (predicted exonuclease)
VGLWLIKKFRVIPWLKKQSTNHKTPGSFKMKVPFLDLKAQYKQIEHEVVPLVTEAEKRHVHRRAQRGSL